MKKDKQEPAAVHDASSVVLALAAVAHSKIYVAVFRPTTMEVVHKFELTQWSEFDLAVIGARLDEQGFEVLPLTRDGWTTIPGIGWIATCLEYSEQEDVRSKLSRNV